MWYWIVALILYFLFKDKINKKIKEIHEWLKKNQEFIDKWKDNAEIMGCYKMLKDAIEEAGLDRKWDILEILNVVGLAVLLLKAIEKAEGGE